MDRRAQLKPMHIRGHKNTQGLTKPEPEGQASCPFGGLGPFDPVERLKFSVVFFVQRRFR
jgi:hypothetical protein